MREGGKTRFLAPELLEGPERFRTSPASDIFSLSMAFYNLWTGEVPFVEVTNDRKAEAAIREGQRPTRPTRDIDLPPETEQDFWQLLVEMWAHEAPQRPSSDYMQRRLDIIFRPLLEQHDTSYRRRH
jgi:serine/threonine protein kinase